MGKSLKSKIMRHHRAVKRQHLEPLLNESINELSAKLQCSLDGKPYRNAEPLNGFLYPND